MKAGRKVIAIDLGAESGRVISVAFSDDRIILDEIHRFPNGPVRIMGHLHWDVVGLYKNIKEGLWIYAQKVGNVDSLGLDTWGVDFALLDADGNLIGLPYHYRDSRTDGMLEEAFRRVSKEEIFEKTGIQFMQINSLYQLLAMKKSPQLAIARTFLMMPDLLNYWLTGVIACEFTDATTTQFYDQRAKGWAVDLLQKMGLPDDIYPNVVEPGTVLGDLVSWVADEVSLKSAPVIAPACHDTGSAVAAVPVKGNRQFVYISSGTWSLVGSETAAPVINAKSLAFNFTNEGGVAGTVRLLKNVTGLWLVQECRRIWSQAGRSYSYAEMAQMAFDAPAFVSFIDPDAVDFLHPSDMPGAIQAFCRRTNQSVPKTREAILRCIYESLAFKYRYVIESLEQLVGSTFEVIHVIGGGSQNELLNQFTANATGKLLKAGPAEATALGNAIVQAVTLGYFSDISEARAAIAQSFPLSEYEPADQSAWDDAYLKFKERILTA